MERQVQKVFDFERKAMVRLARDPSFLPKEGLAKTVLEDSAQIWQALYFATYFFVGGAFFKDARVAAPLVTAGYVPSRRKQDEIPEGDPDAILERLIGPTIAASSGTRDSVTVAVFPGDVDLRATPWGANVSGYLSGPAGVRKVTGIVETTARALGETLDEGIAAGDSIPQLAKRIDALYLEEIIPRRSTVIARTETIAASNYGGQEGAKEIAAGEGMLQKEWISTRDGRTRSLARGDSHDHVNPDGQVRPIDEPYDVSGEKLMFPGDVSLGASAGNTIQCRCTEGYRLV